MKLITLLICIVSFSFASNAQNEKDSFIYESKGLWKFPINQIAKVDSISRDCGGILMKSNSIDLWTNVPEDVRLICSGVVSVAIKLGDESAVIVRSGNVFICYSGLTVLKVKKGDIVEQGEVIGKLAKQFIDPAYRLCLQLYSVNAIELDIKPYFDWTSLSCYQISFL